MEEVLPAATLIGMDDLLTWRQTIESQLVARPPGASARWLRPKAVWPRSSGTNRLAASW